MHNHPAVRRVRGGEPLLKGAGPVNASLGYQ